MALYSSKDDEMSFGIGNIANVSSFILDFFPFFAWIGP